MSDTIRIDEYIRSYTQTISIWITLGTILGLPIYGLWNSLVQTIILLCMTYWGHVFIHTITEDSPFIVFNPHVYLHHQKAVLLERHVELCIEAIVNFSCFFSISLAQYIFSIHLFSTSIILYSAFLYIIIHICDYSVNGDERHGMHHRNQYCNYEPEFIDTLFGTRCDDDLPYRDMNKEIPHAILACILAGCTKVIFGLD